MSPVDRTRVPPASPAGAWRPWTVREADLNLDTLPWLVVALGGVILFAAIWLLGPSVGDLLFRGHPLRPFPAYAAQVMPKPAQLGRFVVAILVALLGAGAIVALPLARFSRARRYASRVAPALVVLVQLAVIAIAVWAWRGQNEGVNSLTPVQFHSGNLLVAALIAAGLCFAAMRGWLTEGGRESARRRKAVWATVALVVSALWLAPAVFRALNLAHSLPAVWYPLQFTFDDFMSVLDGRTPLVNYDTQYASLLPFATEPVFKLFGASVATFTVLMTALSLVSFMCVERALAIIARSERTALVLYVPLLAVSLFTLRHMGNERYFMANYYEVMPIRYVGPFVLFWCLVRHMRGLSPRQPALLFLLAGLVVINNTEFGIPALGGCLLGLASARLVPRAGSLRRLRTLGGELILGVAGAVLIVAAFTLLRSGSLPQLSRLTRYQQVFVVTGFNMSPTPNAGLHIILFMTFVAALLVAAVRVRSTHPDRVLTGALVFSGTFGLGASSYYMGRSLPEVLAALFAAWALATALLCIVVFQTLGDQAGRRRAWPMRAIPIGAVLVILGLFATCIDQFPAPWTQLRRLSADSHTLLFNTAPASRFVRSVSRPGEDVALLTGLGHVEGREAGIIDVSPYSNPEGIITYEQLDDVIAALREDHGDKIFTSTILPELSAVLTARGFRVVAHDATSGVSEWRLAPRHSSGQS